ncbi:MAG: Ldh family oxidoreductase [Phreatobacter sp.]|uniref:Ldh family oxidoreductase n=1 Tax=Phreatobacter sp. TaxID=1966341 RepID=UPI001A4446D3|nr:Ldh family oxidoreductase [Phreatobacter sp.]MBL8571831.1 Ldh family oxidoreductase [Phreatobacter sp.]
MRLTLADAEALAARALIAGNTGADNARDVARALVAAEADGQAGHGLSRVAAYADQARAGKVAGHAVPKLSERGHAALLVDACDGFAFPAIAQGLPRAGGMARNCGVAGMAVTNSHHFGMAGYHVEGPASRGLIALAFGNSPAAIAPWGGKRGLFGTNPIAFACPRERGRPPLVIDLSLSKVARGRIMVAAQKGEAIPEGWALDAEGRPTTDAKSALKGTMIPMGDAKGAALVLMVEILAAALTGANFGYEASSFFDDKGGPPRVGQFFLLIDPGKFAGDGFGARVEVLAQAILTESGTRLPGERRLKLRAKAQADGIEIPDALHADLVKRAG